LSPTGADVELGEDAEALLRERLPDPFDRLFVGQVEADVLAVLHKDLLAGSNGW